MRYLPLVLLLAACGTDATTVEMPADTVYVPIEFKTWVGIEYTFADSGPLNSDVDAKRKAGWDCGESLLDFPLWLPQSQYLTHWALVVAHFYLCVHPYANAEPFTAPRTMGDLR